MKKDLLFMIIFSILFLVSVLNSNSIVREIKQTEYLDSYEFFHTGILKVRISTSVWYKNEVIYQHSSNCVEPFQVDSVKVYEAQIAKRAFAEWYDYKRSQEKATYSKGN